MRGCARRLQPARSVNEKSPVAGSRHTGLRSFQGRFTTFHESVSAAFHNGPAGADGACQSPENFTGLSTAFTSTPINSGSVWAVTSYGRFGGPPGYRRSSGYF